MPWVGTVVDVWGGCSHTISEVCAIKEEAAVMGDGWGHSHE